MTMQTRKKHQERVFGMLDKLWASAPKAKSATVEREVAEAVRAVRLKPIRKKL